jgi:hypothetical protein
LSDLDASLSRFSRQIGQESSVHRGRLDRVAVEAFGRSVSWEIPGEVPPSFLTRFREGEFELLVRLGVELRQVLHAEQEYRWLAPLKADAQLDYRARLADVLSKGGKGGRLTFLKFDSEYLDPVTTRALAQSRTVMVIRESVDGPAASQSQGEPQ